MSQNANLYLMKDLSRLSGHSIYTLKFYLKLGLIQEVGRSPETRFRYFDNTTVDRLARIRVLRKQSKGLEEIKVLLNGSGLGARGSGQVPTAPTPQP